MQERRQCICATKSRRARYPQAILLLQGALLHNSMLGPNRVLILNQRDYRQADAWLREAGLYKRAGRTTQGIFRGSSWSEGKPPKDRTPTKRRKVKPLLPPCQPRETRPAASSRPLIARLDNRSELILRMIPRIGPRENAVFDCLYAEGMPPDAIARRLKIHLYDIAEARDRVLVVVFKSLR